MANAIGAAAGSVSCSCEVRIEPNMNRQLGAEFCLMGPDGFIGFNDYDEALESAKIQVESAVREKATRMGARGDIKVKISVDEDFYQVNKDGNSVFVLTLVTADAVSTLL